MKFYTFVLSISLICSTAYLYTKSNIHEIFSMKELIIPEQNNIFVAFDIDNTLIKLSTYEGSDEWFCAQLSKHQEQGLSLPAAVEKTLPSYVEFQKNGTPNLVEPEVLHVLKQLHNKNIPTIALTARSKKIKKITFKQLSACSIELSYKKMSSFFIEMPYYAKFKEGVIFCGNNDKGDTLFKFFKKINLKPTLVVFVDDKRSHLEAVKNALKKHSISFLGYHYKYLNNRPINLNIDA